MHNTVDYITALLESKEETTILVIVDQFTKIAQIVPNMNNDSPTVARIHLENNWKYHRFPEHVL